MCARTLRRHLLSVNFFSYALDDSLKETKNIQQNQKVINTMKKGFSVRSLQECGMYLLKSANYNILLYSLVDGKYGKWSLNSTCNVTCGDGIETWTRKCNNPEPKRGGRNCSHLGSHIENRRCKPKPCPGKWDFNFIRKKLL